MSWELELVTLRWLLKLCIMLIWVGSAWLLMYRSSCTKLVLMFTARLQDKPKTQKLIGPPTTSPAPNIVFGLQCSFPRFPPPTYISSLALENPKERITHGRNRATCHCHARRIRATRRRHTVPSCPMGCPNKFN